MRGTTRAILSAIIAALAFAAFWAWMTVLALTLG